MNQKVYFAGSIRGGRADAQLYHDIIAMINETDQVLTEHVGDLDLAAKEQGKKDQLIYEKDTAWLRECDLLIAECTCPSLGVGYELAYAERYNKPCYVFYRRSQVQLSAMITGDPYYTVIPYETKEELFGKIREILS
ncbi:MAG: nucleoside 2-deoxyribosyltransferase [Erysipelotrichaceae bacterium]|jgi:nucleoside 2-deoxyribosyltransferase|nr:nucleoside 2-deoxyribosyltransferase [Erysipelotrichaceae bacterium]MDO5108895.1 nucleoside 2-deoxyribosyltransferase [Erysipelotrichaceae bacterium]